MAAFGARRFQDPLLAASLGLAWRRVEIAAGIVARPHQGAAVMEAILNAIVEQQCMLAETLGHLACNGARVGSSAAAALAGTIAQETVRTDKMALADQICLGSGSEDSDKDSLQWPE